MTAFGNDRKVPPVSSLLQMTFLDHMLRRRFRLPFWISHGTRSARSAYKYLTLASEGPQDTAVVLSSKYHMPSRVLSAPSLAPYDPFPLDQLL